LCRGNSILQIVFTFSNYSLWTAVTWRNSRCGRARSLFCFESALSCLNNMFSSLAQVLPQRVEARGQPGHDDGRERVQSSEQPVVRDGRVHAAGDGHHAKVDVRAYRGRRLVVLLTHSHLVVHCKLGCFPHGRENGKGAGGGRTSLNHSTFLLLPFLSFNS
jgi:hypothetical protein